MLYSVSSKYQQHAFCAFHSHLSLTVIQELVFVLQSATKQKVQSERKTLRSERTEPAFLLNKLRDLGVGSGEDVGQKAKSTQKVEQRQLREKTQQSLKREEEGIPLSQIPGSRLEGTTMTKCTQESAPFRVIHLRTSHSSTALETSQPFNRRMNIWISCVGTKHEKSICS